MKAFRRDYYILGKYHLQSQVPHLARLADDYAQRYSKFGHWTDCLKVSQPTRSHNPGVTQGLLRGNRGDSLQWPSKHNDNLYIVFYIPFSLLHDRASGSACCLRLGHTTKMS